MRGLMISQTKPLKIKYFFLFNFAITKICVAIRLVEDGTRMGGIWFYLSPSLVLNESLYWKLKALLYFHSSNEENNVAIIKLLDSIIRKLSSYKVSQKKRSVFSLVCLNCSSIIIAEVLLPTCKDRSA